MIGALLVGLATMVLVNWIAEKWPALHPLTAGDEVSPAARWLQTAATSLVFVTTGIVWLQPWSLAGRLLALVNVALLGVAGTIDLVHRYIFFGWSVAALSAGLLTVLWLGDPLRLATGIVLFGLCYAVWRFSGQLGGGDVWLAAYLGLLLGLLDGPAALLVGSTIGAVVGGTLIALRKLGRRDPIPAGFFWAWAGLALLPFPGLVTSLLSKGLG